MTATDVSLFLPPKAHHSPYFSGRIMYLVMYWTSVVAFPMLCGELCSYETYDIDLTETCRSHHDHSVTCHVSTIQKDPGVSRRRVLGYQHFRRSDHGNGNDTNFRRYTYCERKPCMGLIDEYKRHSFSLAPMRAQLAMRTIYHFWVPLLGYLALSGRSSHCVSQSGLL